MRQRLSRRALAAIGVLGLFMTVAPAFAHHAVQAEFDQNKRKTLTAS